MDILYAEDYTFHLKNPVIPSFLLPVFLQDFGLVRQVRLASGLSFFFLRSFCPDRLSLCFSIPRSLSSLSLSLSFFFLSLSLFLSLACVRFSYRYQPLGRRKRETPCLDPKGCEACLRRATSGGTLLAACSANDVQFVPLTWVLRLETNRTIW